MGCNFNFNLIFNFNLFFLVFRVKSLYTVEKNPMQIKQYMNFIGKKNFIYGKNEHHINLFEHFRKLK